MCAAESIVASCVPDEEPMEEVTDETIDVAGHMQKYAAQGALWLPTNLLAHLPDSTDFQTLEDQKVDGRPVSEWQAVASAQQDESAAAT